MFKRIGIIHHPVREIALDIVETLKKHLSSRGINIRYILPLYDWEQVEKKDIKDVDLIISVGGDGTLIRVAHMVVEYGLDIPIWPISAGEFNFMPDQVEVSDIPDAINSLIIGHIETWNRHTLRIIGENISDTFVNDVVFLKDKPLDILDIQVYIDDCLVGTIKGDGVVVATAAGSTGYSLSAGGPIVDSRLGAYVLMMLNPHHITLRPLVLDLERRVDILIKEKNWHLLIDGLNDIPFEGNELIKISKGDYVIKLIHVKGFYSWADNLYSKFHWGSRYVKGDNN